MTLESQKKSRLPSKQLLFIVCVPVISVSPKQKSGDVTAPKYHFHVVGHIIVFAYPIILQKEYKPFYKGENWICVLTSRNKNKKIDLLVKNESISWSGHHSKQSLCDNSIFKDSACNDHYLALCSNGKAKNVVLKTHLRSQGRENRGEIVLIFYIARANAVIMWRSDKHED